MKSKTDLSKKIRDLSRHALKSIGSSQSARKVLKKALVRPVDYMRYAEFNAVLDQLELKPNTMVLDVSSPQWFCIYLASKYPDTNFIYINIIDSEIEPFQQISQALNLQNLEYLKEDVRELNFKSNSFDQVLSVSVIEHIYPALGGDCAALKEVNRVLKPDGELHLTIPYKDNGNIVYVDGDVYERKGKTSTFFAREYDVESFAKLAKDSGFSAKVLSYIIERPGLFALDYYEWGPGKSLQFINQLPKFLRLAEKLSRYSLDEALAQKNLYVLAEPGDRLVNLAAVLKPTQ